jgi:H+/Cl- antiporter ClcA
MRRGYQPEEQQMNTCNGISAAFGALLPNPIYAMLVVTEIAGARFENYMEAMLLAILSSLIGFFVFTALLGKHRILQFTNDSVDMVRPLPRIR